MTGPVLELQDLTFEELEVGKRAAFTWRVTEEDVAGFAALSGDYSPLHVDEQFARRTRYRARVAHGMLVAAPVSALVGMLIPGKYATLLGINVKFTGPSKPGDELSLEGIVKSVSPAARAVVVSFKVANRARTVAHGEVQILVNPPPKEAPTVSELADQKLGMDFSGTVALVTGASRGIGAVIAKLFATHNASVVVNYLHGADDAQRTAQEIIAHGGSALAVQADVRDRSAVERMIERANAELGGIDVLVNNAVGDTEPTDFPQIGWDRFQGAIDVVIGGAFNCIQAVLPTMLDRGRGQVINLCTTYVETPPARLSAYVTAKAALLGLTRALAVELGPRGVHVNAVSPAMTDTDLIAHLPERDRAAAAERTPLKRLAEPIDVAKAVLFLASPYAEYVNAHELVLSGGGLAL